MQSLGEFMRRYAGKSAPRPRYPKREEREAKKKA
jgi:hypothetical protein